MSVEGLPALNAALNTLAAVLLFLGRRAVKKGRTGLHIRFMVSALVTSALFLTSYLVYHYTAPGMTRYQGEGLSRILYFAILATHVPLAGLMVPFIMAAVWLGWKKRFAAHVRITRVLWPVWMYVSITGVLIYLMLYVF